MSIMDRRSLEVEGLEDATERVAVARAAEDSRTGIQRYMFSKTKRQVSSTNEAPFSAEVCEQGLD
jgi:hypothetical protein